MTCINLSFVSAEPLKNKTKIQLHVKKHSACMAVFRYECCVWYIAFVKQHFVVGSSFPCRYMFNQTQSRLFCEVFSHSVFSTIQKLSMHKHPPLSVYTQIFVHAYAITTWNEQTFSRYKTLRVKLSGFKIKNLNPDSLYQSSNHYAMSRHTEWPSTVSNIQGNGVCKQLITNKIKNLQTRRKKYVKITFFQFSSSK